MCGARASAGLSWLLPEGMDDESLELLLFPAPTAASQSDRRPAPDSIYVEKELRRRSVTRLLLWEEYRAANPDGSGYTWLCTTFEAWKQRARPSIRQTHMVGRRCSSISRATLPSPQWRLSKCSTSKRGS
jgi:transposase